MSKIIVREKSIFLDKDTFFLGKVFAEERYIKYPYKKKELLSLFEERELGEEDKEIIEVYVFSVGDKNQSWQQTSLSTGLAQASWENYLDLFNSKDND
tara:strand:- start:46 stop:339 length:294 start_codon:yes stop_codon:yes gene_type:complete